MKYFICSDLHTEFMQPFEHKILFDKFPDTEGIIIAGDLSTKKYLASNIKYLCDKYKYVIFVSGNHEYYGNSFNQTDYMLDSLTLRYSNFIWLSTKATDVNNRLFIGATLWFKDDPLNILYEKSTNDFMYIKDFRDKVYKENEYALELLNTSINSESIVVTHHLPSYQSVNERYKGDQLNRFFVCDMENSILEKQPKYWISGHTHDSYDYMIGNTRMLCNPLGYPQERNVNFRYDLIIDI